MALIKCPECGRENVSSSASACPSCGYPINQEATASQSIDKREIFYGVLSGQDETIFDNGLQDGTKGKCIEATGTFDYTVVRNTVYVTRYAGTARYTIAGGFLLNNNGEHRGTIPDGDYINTSCTYTNFMGGEDVKTFFWDGKFAEISFGKSSSGSYVRKGDLVAISAMSTGNEPYCYVIYNNTLYSASYIKKERVDEVKNLISSFHSLRSTPTHNSITQPSRAPTSYSYSQTSSSYKPTNSNSNSNSNPNFKKIIGVIAAIIAVILLFKACGGSSYNSNDDKCDVCGKSAYTKLSDGNEYCYTHYKSAIDYYLDD